MERDTSIQQVVRGSEMTVRISILVRQIRAIPLLYLALGNQGVGREIVLDAVQVLF